MKDRRHKSYMNMKEKTIRDSKRRQMMTRSPLTVSTKIKDNELVRMLAGNTNRMRASETRSKKFQSYPLYSYSTMAPSPLAMSSSRETTSCGRMSWRSRLDTVLSPVLSMADLKRRMEARMRARSTALRTVLALEK